MTDTGQIPGEGLPGNPVGEAVRQPHPDVPGNGVPQQSGWGAEPQAEQGAPAYYLDQPAAPGTGLDDEDEVLLMPGPQGSWSDPQPVPVQRYDVPSVPSSVPAPAPQSAPPGPVGLSAPAEQPVPSGLPPAFVSLMRACTNFSNTRGKVSAGMPGPLSVIRSDTEAGVTIASITTPVPFGACDTTLFTTFPRPCSTRIASAQIIGSSAGRSNATVRAAPRRFAVLTTRSTTSRKSIQSRRNSRAQRNLPPVR